MILEKSSNNPMHHIPLKTRYPIQARVRFRERGQSEWREGTTVDISRFEVLFQSGIDLPPKTLIEMQIIFPQDLVGESTASVFCWGRVMGTDASHNGKHGRPVLAAAILGYRLSRD